MQAFEGCRKWWDLSMSPTLHTTEIWLDNYTDSGGMKDRIHRADKMDSPALPYLYEVWHNISTLSINELHTIQNTVKVPFWKFELKILNLTDYLLCRFRMFHSQGCCCNESHRVWENVPCDSASPFSKPKPVSPSVPVGHTGTRPVCFANHKKSVISVTQP